jgi:four helix bundle protein
MDEKDFKRFDLEDRTFEFARRVRVFLKQLPSSICNTEDAKQLARSSASVGANYIEANEALGRKDFLMHIKICRKEAKESRFFLRLLDTGSAEATKVELEWLIDEAQQLTNIFGSIVRKSE